MTMSATTTITTATEFKEADAVFMCQACLVERSAAKSSPDPRYCRGCYDYLLTESSKDVSYGKSWLPKSSAGLVSDLSIRAGDRVMLVGEIDKWRVVENIHKDFVVVSGIPAANGYGESLVASAEVMITSICEHQINGREKMKDALSKDILPKDIPPKDIPPKDISPEENLKKCRETLTKVTANGADPRVIGLWKSKVVQAELLCRESGKLIKKSANGPAKETAEEAEAGPPKPSPTQRKPREGTLDAGVLHACVCGCGLMASKNRNFMPGHDSRFASYIRKLDKGLLKVDELPGLVQAMVATDHELVRRAREHNK